MYNVQARAKGTDKSLLQTGRFVASKTRVIRHETLKSILTQIGSQRKTGCHFKVTRDWTHSLKGKVSE